MSSFLVSLEHIHAIASNSKRVDICGYHANPLSEDELIELCLDMYKLNCAAVQTRYTNAPEGITDEEFLRAAFNKMSRMKCTPVEFVKLVDCFVYQCSEGECAKHPLLDDLRGLAGNALREIVRAEYNAAQWAA